MTSLTPFSFFSSPSSAFNPSGIWVLTGPGTSNTDRKGPYDDCSPSSNSSADWSG